MSKAKSPFMIKDGVLVKRIPKILPQRRTPFEQRLFAKRRIAENGCWEFTGSLTADGYGQMYYNSKVTTVHRAAYLHFIGPVPNKLVVNRKCGAVNCFNPDHLFVGHRIAKGNNGKS